MPLDAKSDMSKIGLFSELGYVTVGDKYVACFGILPRKFLNKLGQRRRSRQRPLIESRGKSKQMMTNCSKMRSGLQDGYFDRQFKRIFEGDTYVDQVRLSKQRIEEAKKNIITQAFFPPAPAKNLCGSGNYFGTLQGPIPALSPLLKPTKPLKPQGKNFYTSPSKKGTGYGYPLVSIGKDYSYVSSPYNAYMDIRKHMEWPAMSPDMNRTENLWAELTRQIDNLVQQPPSVRELQQAMKELKTHHKLLRGPAFQLSVYPQMTFDCNPYKSEKPLPQLKLKRKAKAFVPFIPSSPAKKVGGMKCGTFNPFPQHRADLYEAKVVKPVGVKPKFFLPTSGLKSRPVVSIVYLNVKRAINSTNYKGLQSTVGC
uniref:cilia-and flagella-associated protein 96-like n=1 Tax=Myxine glutinosa TaxID=7769 RepID=UPI00358E60C4